MVNQKDYEKSISIMNNAIRELYTLKSLKSSEIFFLLTHYADNEKYNLKHDWKLSEELE